LHAPALRALHPALQLAQRAALVPAQLGALPVKVDPELADVEAGVSSGADEAAPGEAQTVKPAAVEQSRRPRIARSMLTRDGLEGDACPIATQDVATNLENRQHALDTALAKDDDAAITATSYQIANARQYAPSTFAAAGLTAATTYTNYPFVADAAATVVSAKIVFTGTPSTQPTVGNDVVLTVFKNGATVVATKTYSGNVDAAGTWVALTLSGTLANKQLAAGDTLSCVVVQNGTARIGTASGVNFLVAMTPKAT
jgi:hypothetical protein